MAGFELLEGLLGGGPAGADPKGGPGGCGAPPQPKGDHCGDDWGWETPRGCGHHHKKKHCDN